MESITLSKRTYPQLLGCRRIADGEELEFTLKQHPTNQHILQGKMPCEHFDTEETGLKVDPCIHLGKCRLTDQRPCFLWHERVRARIDSVFKDVELNPHEVQEKAEYDNGEVQT